jgi:hypothetical protein
MVHKIPARHRACAKCGERFSPGQPMISVLSLSLSEEYVRSDFCDRCWQRAEADETLQGVWRSYFPAPPQETDSAAAEDQRILALLLDGPNEPLKAYVLALYLVRRGVLQRVRHPAGARGRTLLYEVVATGECVEVPQLTAAEVAAADLSSLNG